VQSFGVVSYPVKLCEGTVLTTKQYVNALQAETPGSANPNCVGSVNEPVAIAGSLCVYRGNNGGSKETQDENAAFFGKFESPSGEYEGTGGDGELVPFRTKEFSEVTIIKHTKLGSYLSAGGGWAVTAP
jgi:hypothetical protein